MIKLHEQFIDVLKAYGFEISKGRQQVATKKYNDEYQGTLRASLYEYDSYVTVSFTGTGVITSRHVKYYENVKNSLALFKKRVKRVVAKADEEFRVKEARAVELKIGAAKLIALLAERGIVGVDEGWFGGVTVHVAGEELTVYDKNLTVEIKIGSVKRNVDIEVAIKLLLGV